jgi:hypothetical protein
VVADMDQETVARIHEGGVGKPDILADDHSHTPQLRPSCLTTSDHEAISDGGRGSQKERDHTGSPRSIYIIHSTPQTECKR